jgi:prepilin-type N-terminal cleavage/methylation domain-containing protein
MKNNMRRGFTLIELLVVIAIIGILSSVVLASLNTARGKGADAAVKSNLANIRAQAEIQYDTMGCYSNTGTACAAAAPAAVVAGACPAAGAANIFGQANIAAQIAGALSAGGSFGACSATVGGGAWAVAVITKTAVAATANSGWCVDSSGKSKAITVSTLDQAGITAEVASGACVE